MANAGVPGADFYAPFMTGTIISPKDGVRIPLWTNPTPEQLERFGAPPTLLALAFLAELSVTLNLGVVPVISATLTPPLSAGLLFLQSDLIEYAEWQLEVSFGYSAGTTNQQAIVATYSGLIQQPEINISGQDVSITLQAKGLGDDAANSQGKYSTGDPAVGPEIRLPRLEIIKSLLEGPDPNNPRGVELDTSAVDALESDFEAAKADIKVETQEFTALVEKDAGKSRRARKALAESVAVLEEEEQEALASLSNQNPWFLLNGMPIAYSQNNKTDWWCVWELVRECRCSMYINGPMLKIVPINTVFLDPPKRVFRLFHYPGGRLGMTEEGGVWPVLSFSSENTHQYIPASAKGIAMEGIAQRTKKTTLSIYDDAVAKTSRIALGAILPAFSPLFTEMDKTKGTGGGVVPGSPTDPADVQRAMSEADAATATAGLAIKITSLGDPTLMPSDIFLLRGVGRWDGRYWITEIVHRSGLSGYEIDISATSNVRGKASKPEQEGSGDTGDKDLVEEEGAESEPVTPDPS